MSNEHVEYDRDVNPYPSSGKKYNGEKAIISLTSWKARINTVSKTLYSLIKQCPGFHIVLVLSEEEFPQKEKELPEDLLLFVENDIIELLWVYKNYKSFKKVLFTMDKYRDVPIISADDDCIYKCNYAQMLYDEWAANKACCITLATRLYRHNTHTVGCATLHKPYCFLENGIKLLTPNILNEACDDAYYSVLREKYSIPFRHLNKELDDIVLFCNETNPLSAYYANRGPHIFKLYEKELCV